MAKLYSKKIYTLLGNDDFVKWLVDPDYFEDKYWDDYIDNNPELKEEVKTLREIFRKTVTEEPTNTDEIKQQVWSNILKQTTPAQKLSSRRKLGPKFIAGLVSAAVITLMIGGSFLLHSLQDSSSEIDYADVIAEGLLQTKGDNISLIIADSIHIDIDKEYSDLVYDSTGMLNIDSEKVADACKAEINRLVVPYGKTTTITLSDGTRVWVNSGSVLAYPSVFDKKKREIFVSGEVFLDVAKDKTPFIVKTSNMDVRVLGTRFNVSAYNDDVEQSVVLVSGEVSVKGQAVDETKLAPNQMMSLNLNTHKSTVTTVDVSNYTSWINRYLKLQSQSLDVVAQRLERHYNVPIKLDHFSLSRIRVSGKLDLTDNLSEVLDNIRVTTPLMYVMDDEGVTLKYQKKRMN